MLNFFAQEFFFLGVTKFDLADAGVPGVPSNF